MLEFGWTYPSVFDPDGAIRDDLGLLGQPMTLFCEDSDRLVDTWTPPEGGDWFRRRLHPSR